MANCFLIIGKANAGKTLFMVNFAEYMGYKNLTIKFKSANDENIKTSSTGYFKNTIVSRELNTTKNLQIIDINIPLLKGKKSAEFIDTTGLSSSVHFDQDVREGMAQTIGLLKENYMILHMIDASTAAAEKKLDDIDIEIYKYGSKRGNYAVLANKIDLKESGGGLEIIKRVIADARIFEISALYKTGFDEVKKYVSKLV